MIVKTLSEHIIMAFLHFRAKNVVFEKKSFLETTGFLHKQQ